ncbi:MAG: rod shape-determining protein MreC, partial [Proteobacteria bacterium]|nr:rod shape-determining protein MreC [Pseudomonadota bacterium]
QLVNIPKTADIQEGDFLVTSGLDRRFPPGYPVGTVTAVHSEPADHFTHIEITPSAHLNRSRLVLLLWPNEKTTASVSTSSLLKELQTQNKS